MSRHRSSTPRRSGDNGIWHLQIQTIEHYGRMQDFFNMDMFPGAPDEYLATNGRFPKLLRATVKLTGPEAVAQHEKRMAYERKLLTARSELYRVVNHDQTPIQLDEDKATCRAIEKHAHKVAETRRRTERELGTKRAAGSGRAA